MATGTDLTDTLPPRLAWFALWRWKRRWQIIALIACAMFAYPLSIGPALLACRLGVVSVTTVALVYRPVMHCAYKGPSSVGRTMRQYMRWWGNDRAADVWVVHGYRELQRKMDAQGGEFTGGMIGPPAR